jgi:molybdopterin/thiamine biosynthesis adenylyltransferase
MLVHRSFDPQLARARVLVVGVGGLGAPASLALVAAGVGTLGLLDPDRVDASNLHRQPLYDAADAGRLKVEVAAARLRDEIPTLRITAIAEPFEPGDAYRLRDWDAVVDGTDTIAAKFALNDAAVAAGVPLAHAGARGTTAQLLTVLPGASACYRCLFEDVPPPEDAPGCDEAGVLGPVVALAGALQAAEVVRLLGGRRPAFADRLLTIDTWSGRWRTVPLAPNPRCTACGNLHGRASAGRSDVP